MNWKPELSSCLLLTAGVAMAGCGAAADTATVGSTSAANNPVAQQAAETTAAANVTLVTLDLPGMT